jgi:hypothetical protein
MEEAIREFAGALTVPSRIVRPLSAGERVRFEFSGYLNVGASLSAGYEIKGTKDFEISRLKLSEHYQLAIVGRLALAANMAGRHAVEVRPSDQPGWSRVIVRRARSHDVQFAADVAVGAALETAGLPRAGKEFLGALLGVEVKNWLNLFDRVVDRAGNLSSPDARRARLDALSGAFIEQWTGTAVDAPLGPSGRTARSRIEAVVKSHRTLGDRTIALFDRFYDPVTKTAGDLALQLEGLKAMTSWDRLKGETDTRLWNVVGQLTDGDPLGWALGTVPGSGINSLDELRKRAAKVVALIQDDAHEDIRTMIDVAKRHFALDGLLAQLETIDTPDKLKALGSKTLEGFISRLTGTEITAALSAKEVKAVFDIVKRVRDTKERFWSEFDTLLAEAAKQSFGLKLHAAYASADDREALIDVDLRLLNDDGQPNTTGRLLMEAAGRGDFSAVLARYQPEIVRLREGTLTHKLTRGSTVKINITGWHLDFGYSSAYRVITNAAQQIRPTGTGQLTVFTQLDMTAGSEEARRRGQREEERMHANFLLRFIGETRVTLTDSRFDDQDMTYLLDVITGWSASYELTLTDSLTTRAELDEYLQFAAELGLDKAGANAEAIAPALVFSNGSCGPVTVHYRVQFTEAGLNALFPRGTSGATSPIDPDDIRRILRRTVIANYAGAGNVADVGWLFCSPAVEALYTNLGSNFVDSDSHLGDAIRDGKVFPIASPIKGLSGPSLSTPVNQPLTRRLVASLFDAQRDLIGAFTALQRTIGRSKRLREFEDAMGAFGEALNRFDERDMGSHSVFSVLDGLIQLRSDGHPVRASGLTLTTVRDGQERTAIFTLPAAADALAAGPRPYWPLIAPTITGWMLQ